MPSTSLAYRILASAAVPAVPLLFRDQRQHNAHRERLKMPGRMEEWAAAHRNPARPLLWFHAPSVGEGLQARAVMQAVRALAPDAQIVYTHFSPSAADFAQSTGADWSGYLGYDRRRDVDRMLAALQPDVIVFTKLDLWPELAARAAARGTRVAMVAATVNADSGRLKWPTRSLATPGYQSLDAAGAISSDDADRLAMLGCPHDRITVTGDPRIDSVLAVAAAGTTENSRDAAMLVAGSTWPEDEAVVLGAFELVLDRHPDARLIIAPHDPTPGHLQRVTAIAKELGLPAPVRLGKVAPGDAPAITLVDRLGILSRLYGRGSMAYVGGGWGRHGIHSVLEPAAWGCPVIIGPNDRGSRDAQLLDRAGALRRLSEPASLKALAAVWTEWLDGPDELTRAGEAARAALGQERGAAEKSADLVLQLLKARSRSPS